MTPDQYATLRRKDVADAAAGMTAAEHDRLMREIDADCYFENLFDDMEDDDE